MPEKKVLPMSPKRLFRLDLKIADVTGERGVHLARAAIAEAPDIRAACALFKQRSGISIESKHLRQLANLSTKQSVKAMRKRLAKLEWEDRFASQFRRTPGSSSVRSTSGGLPGQGRRA